MALTPSVPPSGHQFELAYEDQRAVVTEVGAGLRAYAIGERQVLDGYGPGDMCSGGRGQVLIPWPNRLAGGRYRLGGAELQLPLTEPERGNAIHGLVRWANWRATEERGDRVVLRHLLHPQPGYPFTLAVDLEYRLASEGLTVTTTATNVGDRALPFGAGFHPYLTAGTDSVDDAILSLPAHTFLETDAKGIPTGREQPVDGSPYDFLGDMRLGATQLDTCFTALDPSEDGATRVTLAVSGRDHAVTLWMDSSFDYLMVFTGDTLEPARRRRGLAVEPMTCAPDAFNNHRGLRILEPGETTVMRWGIEPG